MRNRIQPTAFLILASLLTAGCSVHLSRRVNRAYSAVTTLLIDYLAAQLRHYSLTQRFDTHLQPGMHSGAWDPLSPGYQRVLDAEYSCSFRIASQTFSAVCSPRQESGHLLVFRTDQSCSIQMIAPGSTESRSLWLTEAEQARLRDAQGATKFCPAAMGADVAVSSAGI